MQTLSNLLALLEPLDPSHPLVFTAPEGEVSPGYQVTELRHLTLKGIDCGGNIEGWSEARLQLLEGRGTTYMTVGTFRGIAAKSLFALPELADVPLLVEYGQGNAELRTLSLHPPQQIGARVQIALGEMQAVCKPAARASAALTSSCCGTSAPAQASAGCCGSDMQAGCCAA